MLVLLPPAFYYDAIKHPVIQVPTGRIPAFPHSTALNLLAKYCKALKRHKTNSVLFFYCQLLLVGKSWEISFVILLLSNVSSIKINFVPLSLTPSHMYHATDDLWHEWNFLSLFFSFSVVLCSPKVHIKGSLCIQG